MTETATKTATTGDNITESVSVNSISAEIFDLDKQIHALKLKRQKLVDKKIELEDVQFENKMNRLSDKFLVRLHQMMRRAQKEFQSNDKVVEYDFGSISGRSPEDIDNSPDDKRDLYEVARAYRIRLEKHEKRGTGVLNGQTWGPTSWYAARNM